ncbi:hypothetical protein HDU67_010140 [Dinochytrium kinnereticum]|nr:hypothetical protein HDU67_010140 [Dinochytrium kinnereticum]
MNPQLITAFQTSGKVEMEVSVHRPGRHLRRELGLVFMHYGEDARRCSGVGEVRGFEEVVVLTTFQRAQTDLVAVTGDSNWERNLLLETFTAYAHKITTTLRSKGYWADSTDPASGYPVLCDRGTSLYPDVDGAHRLLKYPTLQAGCCRVLAHPRWGTRCYPGTMFTTAPVEVVEEVLRSVGDVI